MTHPSPHRRYRGQADQDAIDRRERRAQLKQLHENFFKPLFSAVEAAEVQLHAHGPHQYNPHTDSIEADDTLAAYGQQDGPLDQWD